MKEMPALRGAPRLFVVLALASAAAGGGGSRARAQDDTAPYIARIEAAQLPDRQGFDGLTVQELMQRLHVPGVSVAVVKDYQIHWARTYGVADVETGRPTDATTMFQAASISKPVTAMAAMRLVQEHRLDLDRDVNSFLKSWRVPASDLTGDRPVTPRALFSHTSGADDGFGFPGYDPTAQRPTLVQILDGQPPSKMSERFPSPARLFRVTSIREAASPSCSWH
jgi:CubicO group peptidase (beta-lactamase class C family)